MLKLVRHCYKRTVLTETVLVISISVCTNSTLYRNSAGTSRKCLVYPEFVFVLGGLHCTQLRQNVLPLSMLTLHLFCCF